MQSATCGLIPTCVPTRVNLPADCNRIHGRATRKQTLCIPEVTPPQHSPGVMEATANTTNAGKHKMVRRLRVWRTAPLPSDREPCKQQRRCWCSIPHTCSLQLHKPPHNPPHVSTVSSPLHPSDWVEATSDCAVEIAAEDAQQLLLHVHQPPCRLHHPSMLTTASFFSICRAASAYRLATAEGKNRPAINLLGVASKQWFQGRGPAPPPLRPWVLLNSHSQCAFSEPQSHLQG